MSSELFGTDGIRGIPGRYPLVPDLVRKLGFVASGVMLRRGGRPGPLNGSPPPILIGRDSRASGAALSRQLAQGFAKAGCAAIDAGVIPTPALSYLVPRRGVLFGAMVSASHNPAEFNGIKFFTRDGFKMGPDLEKRIEAGLESAQDPGSGSPRLIDGAAAAARDYADFLRSTFPVDLDLRGKKIAVDCANGAASKIAPRLLRSLGADVFAVGCSPDGTNINRRCGALDTRALCREVRRRGCACGVAFDGDADRAVFADERGRPCDGDLLLSMLAADLREKRLLRGGTVVLTVMSNYGLIRWLGGLGIKTVTVPVGDRNVTEAIEKERLSLGGESSGHIVLRRFAPTGDGLLTALQILAILVREGRPLSAFRERYRAYPQVLRNVRVDRRVPLEDLPETGRRIRAGEERLRGAGRVFVRYSGTEPLLRILVEGPRAAEVRGIAEEIASVFSKEMRTHAG